MRRHFSKLLFFLLSTCVAASAQHKGLYEKLVSEGNRYYNDEQYHLAIELFTEAVSFNVNDPAVDFKLAEAYRFTFNYPEAEGYYLKVLYTGQSTYPLSLFYYALMLKLNGNFPEAIERFDQFITFHEQNQVLKDFVEQAIIEKAGCEIAQRETTVISADVHPLPGLLNTPYNDFAPAFQSANTLIITSSRITSNRTLIDERYGEAFTDNYYFERAGERWEDKTHQQFWITNSLYNDGSGSFTRNGGQYFFTICEERCRIFETRLENSKWTKPSPLNQHINTPGFDSKQPAIAPSGDTLYFASNRPGGHGLFDIWESVRSADGQWGPPVNAGNIINTKANDVAPALSGSAGLFFASEGHPGYGGYDLFLAIRPSQGDTVLYNLNLPFNSAKDDCFLTFNGKEIFWSSNRTGGKGGFDIYGNFDLSAKELVAKLKSKNRNDSRSATLTSRTAKSEHLHLLASRNEETIDYNNLTYERKAIVNRMVENRLNNIENKREEFPDVTEEEFQLLKEISYTRFQTLLLKEKYASRLLTEITNTTNIEGSLSITGELIDSVTEQSLSSMKILLTNEFGEILKITSTNERGHFRFTDVEEDSRLFLRLETTPGRMVTARVKNVQLMGSDKHNTLYVENVYFDFDHYIIRPEAGQVLTELAAYLKSNPGAQVEIYAFADDRGSSAYNFELTQKRGEAVVSFLKKHGVDETSLAIIPKGKQSIKQVDSEIQRQYNRRAQFYINGVREIFTPLVKTYIAKKAADWNVISKMTGIPKEELRTLNAFDTELVKPFQPIRLPMNAKSIPDELFFVGI